jgi:restriction system protein
MICKSANPLTLGDSYEAINKTLMSEVLEKVKGCTPDFLEKMVVQLVVEIGYGGSSKEAGQVIGKSRDGVDGIIKEDLLGLDVIYVQTKRWE